MRRYIGALAGFAGFAFVLVLAAATAEAGPKWQLPENSNSWMQMSVLLQPQYRYIEDAADQEDFYLRRGRLIFSGQVQEGVKFFVDTDNDKAGMNGAGTVQMDIQDAFVDVQLAKDHSLQAGLILLPFSFENRSSAGSLLGVDFNSEAMKMVNDFVWRDYGAELSGKLGERVAYKIGAFDGYDPYENSQLSVTKNDAASLRFDGHLSVNLIGAAENEWFFTNNRLGKTEDYLAIGVGMDSEDNATRTTITDPITQALTYEVMDSKAEVVDLQSGFGLLDELTLMVNAGCYHWDNAVFDGNTVFLESGLLYQKVMLTGKCGVTDPDTKDTAYDYTAGIHYFLKGHNARAGVEGTFGDTDSTDGRILMGLQILL